MPGYQDALAVADGIHLALSALHVVVDEHLALGRNLGGDSEVANEFGGVADDLHGPPAEHVAGSHHHGIFDALGDSERLVNRVHGGSGRAAGCPGRPGTVRTSAGRWRCRWPSALEPRMGKPAAARDWERLMAVCPPNCTRLGGGLSSTVSLSMMSRTASSSRGSKYRRSLVSKSVETVSGLELTMMLDTPAWDNAHAACTLQ